MLIGRPIPSTASPTLAAGRGTYINDIDRPGMAHAAFVRSPYAHARIRAVDTTRAVARPGVIRVLTGAEALSELRPIPSGADPVAMGARSVEWRALAADRVRYVGEAVAAVIAEDRWTAYAALDDVDVDYEELPAVTDPLAALLADAPLVEPAWGDNLVFSRRFDGGDIERAFREAEGIVSGTVRSNRITGVPIEPRGCVADFDAHAGHLTYWDATQQPHVLRTFLAETIGLAENAVRVIQPAVGGAFGLKQPLYQEQPVVAWASMLLGRPVKWIEERTESFLVGGHARHTQFHYEASHRSDGTVTGLRVRVVADVGAPTALLGWTMSFVSAYCLPGPYDIEALEIDLQAVVTNKCPWSPYRGFGKDAASLLMDRVMDDVARQTGVDRAETRLRNFIPPDAFPYARPGGAILDSGDYPTALRRVLEMADYAGFPALQAEARASGRRIGLGIGQELTPEGVAIPGSLMNQAYDGATVRIAPGGDVTVLAGVTTPGTGNETALAQLAADAIGCRLDAVRVIQGDTDLCPYGLGNYSSRSVMYGGSAVRLAALDLRAKLLAVASRMLEAEVADLESSDGLIFVGGTPARSVSIMSVVDEIYRHTFGANADGVEPGLESTRYYRSENIYHQPETQGRFSTYPTWPNGAAACIVEVDPETGIVRILRHCLVEDAGTIVNPLLATAVLHGGIGQGIGSALYESLVYDDTGQLLTATLMDYTIPTAVELPRFEVEHQETPSPFTPLGMKGVGESGMGSSLGALCSAIENAFPDLDLRLTDLPLTPHVVWRAIRAATESRPRTEVLR